MAQPKPKTASKLDQLKDFTAAIKDKFKQSHQDANSWLESKSVDVAQLRHQSKDLIAAASIAGSLAMRTTVDAQVNEQLVTQTDDKNQEVLSHVTQDEYATLIDKMKAVAVMPAGHLDKEQELYLEQQLSDLFGFEVTAELDGHRLNHSHGIMGSEQHLKRFPGDDLSQHDRYQEAGIAPARGAFGWFTDQGQLTAAAIDKERYYFAVQTLYLPDWNTNHRQLKPWYMFRKMIVINPAEELAVVGVVGDAGPAQWVKKQYGGSPEVIREGKIWSPAARGRVILFFVDDPEDQIPLGLINIKDLSSNQV